MLHTSHVSTAVLHVVTAFLVFTAVLLVVRETPHELLSNQARRAQAERCIALLATYLILCNLWSDGRCIATTMRAVIAVAAYPPGNSCAQSGKMVRPDSC